MITDQSCPWHTHIHLRFPNLWEQNIHTILIYIPIKIPEMMQMNSLNILPLTWEKKPIKARIEQISLRGRQWL